MTLGRLRLADFSVYDLLDPNSVMNIFTEKPHILAFWSHRIERAVVDYQLQGDMFVGFQKLSRFLPVMHHYEHIAQSARRIWIFGEADVPVPRMCDQIRFVTLSPDDALSREWFMVVHAPVFTRALVAREITSDKRLYEGVLTSDVPVIEEMENQLLQLTASLR